MSTATIPISNVMEMVNKAKKDSVILDKDDNLIDLEHRYKWFSRFWIMIGVIVVFLIIILYVMHAYSIPDLTGIWDSSAEGDTGFEIFHNRLGHTIWFKHKTSDDFVQGQIKRNPDMIVLGKAKASYTNNKIKWNDGVTHLKVNKH
jgi:hypothetical protein